MSEAPMTYFKKEILGTKFWLPNGKQAPWEPVGDDTGILATNAPNLIFHLNNAAEAHVGGIVRITPGQYDQLKKNSTAHVSPRPLERESIQGAHRSGQGPSAAPLLIPVQPKPKSPTPAAAVAVAVSPTPVQPAPQTPQKVRTGRLKKSPSALP